MTAPASPYRIFDFQQVQVQVQVAPVTAANLGPHLAAETARIKEKLKLRPKAEEVKKAVVVVDIWQLQGSDPIIRKMQSDWMKQHEDLLRLTTGAMAFVVKNPVIRHTLTAVLWLAPLPMPITTHDSLETAVDWAIGEVTRRQWGDISMELLMEGAMAIEKHRVGMAG